MKRVLIYAASSLLAVLVLLLAWGFIEPYMLDVKTYDVPIPNLPAAWEGQQIGLVADWQIGMWLDNTSTVAQSVERLVAARPATALLAGDFVYGPSDDIEEDAREAAVFARPLVDAGIPTYAVLGNHDYGLNHSDDPVLEQRVQAVRTALAAQGCACWRTKPCHCPYPRRSRRRQVPPMRHCSTWLGSALAGRTRTDQPRRSRNSRMARHGLL